MDNEHSCRRGSSWNRQLYTVLRENSGNTVNLLHARAREYLFITHRGGSGRC